MSTSPGLPTPGHAVFEELTVGFALDALEPGEEAVILDHLPDCERCQRGLAAHREVAAHLALALEPSEPLPLPPALAHLVETVPQEMPPDPFPLPAEAPARLVERGVGRRRVAMRHVRRVAVGAGVAAVLAVGTLSAYDLHVNHGHTTTGAAAALEAVADPHATIAHLGGSTGSAVTVVSNGHAWLVEKGLAASSTSQRYVVWDLNTSTALAGFTQPSGTGPEVVDLGKAPTDSNVLYAVSREKGASGALPAKPAGPVVLRQGA